jgi:hypothetical protein
MKDIHKMCFIIAYFLSSLELVSAQEIKLNWTMETEVAGWQPRDSHAEFVYKNHLWIMGGWDTPSTPNLLDVWKSRDGKVWIRVLETAPWIQSDLPVSLVFKNKLWIMGGRKLPGTVCSNKVWSSGDGIKWELVTPAAGWSPRLASGFAVFKDRMWIFGGTSDFYINNDTTLFNDVWSSADGKEWRQELENAPWSKRAHGQAVVFNNKLWIMGGGALTPARPAMPLANNDVWCSDDGINWTQVSSSADWEPRIWFSSVVYRDRMWVIGGLSTKKANLGDVWYSRDGKNWIELKSDNIWSPRHEHSTVVFKDKIWVAGGAAEPLYQLNSELWSLKIPRKGTLK